MGGYGACGVVWVCQAKKQDGRPTERTAPPKISMIRQKWSEQHEPGHPHHSLHNMTYHTSLPPSCLSAYTSTAPARLFLHSCSSCRRLRFLAWLFINDDRSLSNNTSILIFFPLPGARRVSPSSESASGGCGSLKLHTLESI
mmetsp:Transcript_36594/g.91651  ORF Transcript_36594/g.91651 Transcript_36594/m.91651 type:complete len:142 (-) Transcript_36594:1301-1726(-)